MPCYNLLIFNYIYMYLSVALKVIITSLTLLMSIHVQDSFWPMSSYLVVNLSALIPFKWESSKLTYKEAEGILNIYKDRVTLKNTSDIRYLNFSFKQIYFGFEIIFLSWLVSPCTNIRLPNVLNYWHKWGSPQVSGEIRRMGYNKRKSSALWVYYMNSDVSHLYWYRYVCNWPY